MADYKQYITQVQESGTVMISEDVVATIVINAIEEVEGISQRYIIYISITKLKTKSV